MPLKTLVKVGNISNLSDARYCSGMGVDMLGFCVVETMPSYLSPKLYQEIRGWITGPSVVAEIYGLNDAETLNAILQNYLPDYLECSVSELQTLDQSITLPVIVSVTGASDIDMLLPWKDKIAYIQVQESANALVTELSSKYQVLVSLQSGQVTSTLLDLPIQGIALNGSAEIRPGFKDYDNLADVLEQLETD